ncbi:MAG TPA: hypothetical protein VN703_02500, partial [Candidatus Sulfopaludibacter sp.]|nr:hypothetical protein [Candidatus Sulfopaludibacter sp.]
NQDLLYEQQGQNITALELIEKDNTNSCSSYRYTLQQIEEFFASDNGQVEEHILDDRVFADL